ncbi:50S ribosomal protein L11 methyltransferase [uncultured Granulicatella sp.]|uniref:50S ribosomal protein L11 methyltransferase n=1 Tax=uncultured Granulicatella sp. TaxID=316089 RepID=UPI0028DC176C|nr:50S ribosomal protein L11 methyltransferase [uncultured Granulicatella sp.]
MNWLEVSVNTHSESVEVVGSILIELGSKGVSIEDPQDYYQLTDEQLEWLKVQQKDLYETDTVIVKGYFQPSQWSKDSDVLLHEKLEEIKVYGLQTGPLSVQVKEVGEEDWANAWKQYYFPVRVTRFLTVVPSWVDYEKEQDDELLIELDPGLAFGTGTHPTTQLSLTALEQTIRGNESVLDVGTGSGVLSIASKLLGASKVTAFDIDEMATRVAKENIALNPTIGEIEVYENNLLVGVDQKSDLIVANILAEILLQMPEDAYRNLNEDGRLILSGIIESKANEVKEAYEKAGFTLFERMTMREWNCFIMKKDVE